MYLSIGLLCLTLLDDGARAQSACTYETVYFDIPNGGYVYALRSDGFLVRYGLVDKSVITYTNPAPAGKYVGLFRYEPNPYLDGLFALRDDGALFFLKWGGLNETWTPLATLPACLPIPTSNSTIGGVKSKYR